MTELLIEKYQLENILERLKKYSAFQICRIKIEPIWNSGNFAVFRDKPQIRIRK